MSEDLLDAVAIIGMSCRFPRSNNTKEFWNNLCQGVDCITQLTHEELSQSGVSESLMYDPKYVKRAAMIERVDNFDAEFFNYSDYEAALIDPQQRMFLEEVFHCFEDAGYDPYQLTGKVGVYAGSSFNMYFYNHFSRKDDIFANPSEFALLLHSNGMDYLSTRVAYKFGFTGPALNVQTACSTSLTAVHEACLSLQNVQCDIAVAGGVSLILPQDRGYLYEKGSLLSQDGYCRVFDKKASGTIFGSGVGVVLLKRYEDAVNDNDKIYAVIRGSALNNDGSRKAGYTAPSIQGQTEVIAEALHFAGVLPEDVSYIETHGTGTEMGDNIELSALTNIFGNRRVRPCYIGSVKTNVGHLLAASGIAGLIKTALMIHYKKWVPHLYFNESLDVLRLANDAFKINVECQPWVDESNQYLSGVSSFGIGGTNVHMVLSAPPFNVTYSVPHEAIFRDDGVVFIVSAKHPESLIENLQQLLTTLTHATPSSQYKMASSLQLARHHFAYRYCFNLKDLPHLNASKLDKTLLTPVVNAPHVALSIETQHSTTLCLEILMQSHSFLTSQIDQCASILREARNVDLFELSKKQSKKQLLNFIVVYTLSVWILNLNIKPTYINGSVVVEMATAVINGGSSLKSILLLLFDFMSKQELVNDFDLRQYWQVTLLDVAGGAGKTQLLYGEKTDTVSIQMTVNTPPAQGHWFTLNTRSNQANTALSLTPENFYQSALNCFAQLWCLGVEVNFAALYDIQPEYKDNDLPLYSFRPQKHWVERKSTPVQSTVVTNTTNLSELTIDQLTSILEGLLGKSSIQAHDNFFDLGGHSLLLARLINTLDEQFQIQIEMRTLYEYPSVSSLMHYLKEHQYVNG